MQTTLNKGMMQPISMNALQAKTMETATPVRFGATSTVNPNYSGAMKKLSFKLFEQVGKTGLKDTNTVFSPASLGLAFSMVLNGTDGTTKTETQNALQMTGLNMQDINDATKAYANLLEKTGDPKVKVEIANAIWASAQYPLEQPFVNTMKKDFNAEVANLNFSNKQLALDTINGHIAQKTNNLIPQMLDDIKDDTIAALVNTTYLNAEWTVPFDAADNYKDKFTTTSGQKKDVNYMTRTGNFQYMDNQRDGFEAIKLPYGQKKDMSMVILLPKAGNTLENLASKLNSNTWQTWSDQLKQKPLDMGRLDLPKHEVTFDVDGAVGALKSIGMNKIFKAGQADFTPMFGKKPYTDKIYVNEVKHKAVIKVNEKGTEAAAATYVGFGLECARMEPTPNFVMKADHGFISIIQDEKTNTPLFITTVDNPDLIDTVQGDDN